MRVDLIKKVRPIKRSKRWICGQDLIRLRCKFSKLLLFSLRMKVANPNPPVFLGAIVRI